MGVNLIVAHHLDDHEARAAKPLSHLILIGTSTGGPKALSEVFEHLPVLANTACCVVQHMPAGFTRNLARRIEQISSWHCEEAAHQQPLQSGFVYIAPGGFQTRLESSGNEIRFSVADTGLLNGHQPSVDVLFESALSVKKIQLTGVLMTGMGADGARGLKQLHDAGWRTLVESQETCIVFGMPRVAIQLGAVDKIVPLSEIAQTLVELVVP